MYSTSNNTFFLSCNTSCFVCIALKCHNMSASIPYLYCMVDSIGSIRKLYLGECKKASIVVVCLAFSPPTLSPLFFLPPPLFLLYPKCFYLVPVLPMRRGVPFVVSGPHKGGGGGIRCKGSIRLTKWMAMRR